jgi:hypothetical protein
MQKFVVVRHVVPTLWPIQESIHLTQKEVTTIKKQGFHLTTYVETMFKV